MNEETIRQHAKKQGVQIKAVLEELCNALLELDVVHENGTNTSFYIDYDERDMLNAVEIVYSVCGNYAMKHGILTNENVTEKITRFRDMLKETFGIDTVQEVEILGVLADVNNILNGNG